MLRRVFLTGLFFLIWSAANLPIPAAAAEGQGQGYGLAIMPYGAVMAAFTAYNQSPADERIVYPGSPADERGFRLVRAQIGAGGKAYWDWLSMNVAGEAVQNSDGKFAFNVEYAYVNFAYLPPSLQDGPFQPMHGATIGAMKIPFSRQSLVSTSMLQFIRRAIVVEEMPVRYDIGATINADYKIKYPLLDVNLQFGVFNGRGNRIFAPDNNVSLQYVGRAHIDLLQTPPAGESASDSNLWGLFRGNASRPHLGLGYSQLQNNDLGRVTKALGLEANVEWQGMSLSGEYIHTRFEPRLGETRVHDSMAGNYTSEGWYIQGGLFVWPQILELAGRYEEYSMDLLAEWTPIRRLAATTAGINVHIADNHKAKFMADYTWREELKGLPKLKNDSINLAVGMMF